MASSEHRTSNIVMWAQLENTLGPNQTKNWNW